VRFSPPTLHAPVIVSDEHHTLVQAKMAALLAKRPPAQPVVRTAALSTPASVTIPLPAVSLTSNFDSFIQIQLRLKATPSDQVPALIEPMIVDTGNSSLIVPNGEDLIDEPDYTILARNVEEPWGCLANIYQGPVDIPTADGTLYTIPQCIFFGCIANNKKDKRTANFGAGRIEPLELKGGVPMPSALGQDPNYPYAEFDLVAADKMFSAASGPQVVEGSRLILHAAFPDDFANAMIDIVHDRIWMSVVPQTQSLLVNGFATGWPPPAPPAASPDLPGRPDYLALVDTGGGPLLIADPDGLVWSKTATPAECPCWAEAAWKCVADSFTLALVDASDRNPYAFSISTKDLPPPAAGLTAVISEDTSIIQGQDGLNIGGIFALTNRILVDYRDVRVGFLHKPAAG
jgi:hypothetical protein